MPLDTSAVARLLMDVLISNPDKALWPDFLEGWDLDAQSY
jgi:hypothetical protein